MADRENCYVDEKQLKLTLIIETTSDLTCLIYLGFYGISNTEELEYEWEHLNGSLQLTYIQSGDNLLQ